jgi:hypothetical protein
MFGIEAYNDDGDVVFNSTDPVFVAVAKGVLSTSLEFSGNDTIVTAENYSPFYAYSGAGRRARFASPQPGEFYFFNLPTTGSRLHNARFSDGLAMHTSDTQLKWVKCIRASDVTPSTTGYGIHVSDANGNLTWTSTLPLVSIKGTLEDTTLMDRWFHITPNFSFVGQQISCRGLKTTSSGFTREHWRFGSYYSSGQNSGYLQADRKIRGLVAAIDYDALSF